MKSIGQIAGLRLPRRLMARLAASTVDPPGLAWQPPPPLPGDQARGIHLAHGIFLFDGHLIEAAEQNPWDIPAPSQGWADALHGHRWLRHAAALQDTKMRAKLLDWVWSWLDRYELGTGAGWAPDVTARRMTYWIAHAPELLEGRSSEQVARFFRALGVQMRFVEWRWLDAPHGLGRIEALAGLVYAMLSLEGAGLGLDRAIADLGQEAEAAIDPDGAVPSRNPEVLAQILSVLIWSQHSIEQAGRQAATGHSQTITRALPVLQALRHPSGALPRFHGAGALIESKTAINTDLEDVARLSARDAPMGYRVMQEGDALLIADAAPAPSDPDAVTAHASPLALEFAFGTQPIFVNCGTGKGCGPEAERASRRAAAHTMIEIAGQCPATEVMSPDSQWELTLEGPVTARTSRDDEASWFLGESAHYLSKFGVHVERRLKLLRSGWRLEGEDTALATAADKRRQATALFGSRQEKMAARFHLHPSVQPSMALNGRAVSLKLPDGSLWMFVSDSEVLSLQPSLYHDPSRPKPRATSQIVASSTILDYWGRITWSLERLLEGDTPLHRRIQRASLINQTR